MSKLKKSLKATGDNLKKSGLFAISPYQKWMSGLLSALEKKGSKLGNKHLGFTLEFCSYHFFLLFKSTVLEGVTIPLGAIAATVCVIAGLTHGSYSMVYDLVNLFIQDDIVMEEFASEESTSSHEAMMEYFNTSKSTAFESATSYSQSYVEEISNSELNSVKIERLNLTKDEWALFENCLDPVTKKIINIPVTLNEQAYDLNTLLPLLHTTSMDPIKQKPFVRGDIIFDTKMALEIDKTIQLVLTNRHRMSKNLDLRGPFNDFEEPTTLGLEII